MQTTRRSDGTNPHTVAFVLEDDAITSQFDCGAASTADCHFYRDCDCDYACDEHAPVLHDECWMKGWFDNLMAVEELHCDREPYTLARVPIAWEADDNGFTWAIDRTPPTPPHPLLFSDDSGGAA